MVPECEWSDMRVWILGYVAMKITRIVSKRSLVVRLFGVESLMNRPYV